MTRAEKIAATLLARRRARHEGKTYGETLVLEVLGQRSPTNRNAVARVWCCRCGDERTVELRRLAVRGGACVSCAQSDARNALLGTRHGSRVIIACHGRMGYGTTYSRVTVACDCGSVRTIATRNFLKCPTCGCSVSPAASAGYARSAGANIR